MKGKNRTTAAVPAADKGDNGANSAISAHVLPTSATMVGVCMTVIGILFAFEIV